MMKAKYLELNLKNVKGLDEFYDELQRLLGFPDFFGRNVDALVDCLSGLRYPEEGMTNMHLDQDEYLILEVIGLSEVDVQVKDSLFFAVEFSNYKNGYRKGKASILILPKHK